MAEKSFRIVDPAASEAGEPASERRYSRRREPDPGPDPNRPSVEEKIAYYQTGPGWFAALKEAWKLIGEGEDPREVAKAVGWTDRELKRAMQTGKPRKTPDPFEPILQEEERAPRTLKQRVESLVDIPRALMKRARHLYEIEFMTIKEVASALNQPTERTHLILIKANTKFRRGGRRSHDQLPGSVSDVDVE